MSIFSSQTARARTAGGIVLVSVFVAGIVAGATWPRNRTDRIDVNVRMTTELPRELRRLGLSPAQQDSLRTILADGQIRMRRVLSDFEPRLRGVTDSVSAAMRTVLTPDQQREWDAVHKPDRRDQIQLDTVRRP